MDSKMFDDNYRKIFIQGADFKTLNNYLKRMEILSKKGGRYLEAYNKDMDYLLNDLMDDDILGEDTHNPFNLLFGSNLSAMSEMPTNDTEMNIQHINRITHNVVSNNMVNKNKDIFTKIHDGDDVLKKLEQLNKIEICIRDEYNDYSETSTKNAIKHFIDIIMECSQLAVDGENKILLLNSFKTITSLIKDNKIAVKEGYRHFSNILKQNKNKIIVGFIKKLKMLKNEKTKMSEQQYKQEKNNLVVNGINTHGIECILTSILFNRVVDEYKK